MCGFTITKNKIKNLIKHRGTEQYETVFNGWYINFMSLPLSSNKTGITQPLLVKNHLLVFNGEIFNYKDLSKNCRSDLHYIYDLFNKLGSIDDFYNESIKWDGFWSFCIINQKGEVFSFTDPLGKKQLYYSIDGISSEIKPLLKSDYYYLDYTEKQFGTLATNFTTVERFLPGFLYKYTFQFRKPSLIKKQKYFTKTTTGNLYDLIDKSVTDRLHNKIDGISLLLSGGLDSNIILHHVLKQTKEIDIVSYLGSESELVKEICDANSIEVKFVNPNEEFLNDAVCSYEHSLDFGSLLPNYQLFKNCSNSIILTGDGSDEFFGGYQRNTVLDTWDYDVFFELPYYHNIRLDRCSMAFTKEARSPLMSNPLVSLARNIKWKDRINKKILRETYKEYLPDIIIKGEKKPLRHKENKEYNKTLVKKIHQKQFGSNNFKNK